MPTPLYCAFCASPLIHYGTGRSEFEYSCDDCGAGFAIDEAQGLVKSRRWDRKAARGVHDEFPLSKLQEVPTAPPLTSDDQPAP